MECIICQDTGLEPVQDNTTCSCKYKCHPSCWVDYVHSREKVICPLCRKDLTVKKTPKTKSSMNTPLRASAPAITTPYAPQLRTIPEDSGRQITYQEFVDTINNHMATHNTVIEVHQPPQRVANPQRIQTKGEKIAKLVVILGIIVAVVVLIWIFA
jgi:uncharacterized Zn finger protein (UPF0148 family)